MKRLIAILTFASLLTSPAQAREVDLHKAQGMSVKTALSIDYGSELLAGAPDDLGPTKTRRGFCRYNSWAQHRVVNCWVYVDFTNWPGCWIADQWRVRYVNHRLNAKRLQVWTTGSTACPGFGTVGV